MSEIQYKIIKTLLNPQRNTTILIKNIHAYSAVSMLKMVKMSNQSSALRI